MNGGSPTGRVMNVVRSYRALVLLSLIWGMAFVAIRVADLELSAVNLAIMRWGISSAGFLVLAPFYGKPAVPFQRRDLPRLLLVSFMNVVVYHVSINYGEKTVSAGVAGLLVSVGPVFIVLLSAVVLREKMGARIGLSLLLATVGAVVLVLPQLNQGGGSSVLGDLSLLVTAGSYACFAVYSKPLVVKYGPFPVLIWISILGTLMLAPAISSQLLVQAAGLDTAGWVSVLYLSLFSTVGGYGIFYLLVSRHQVSKLSIQLYLIPVVSVVGGALILGEQVNAFVVVGGAAMLAAVALSSTVRT